jgi:hypothetical protein
VIILMALSDCVLFVVAITLAMLAGIVNWIRAKLLAYVVDILLWMANRVVKGMSGGNWWRWCRSDVPKQ